jgi:hypothetical protein
MMYVSANQKVVSLNLQRYTTVQEAASPRRSAGASLSVSSPPLSTSPLSSSSSLVVGGAVQVEFIEFI